MRQSTAFLKLASSFEGWARSPFIVVLEEEAKGGRSTSSGCLALAGVPLILSRRNCSSSSSGVPRPSPFSGLALRQCRGGVGKPDASISTSDSTGAGVTFLARLTRRLTLLPGLGTRPVALSCLAGTVGKLSMRRRISATLPTLCGLGGRGGGCIAADT